MVSRLLEGFGHYQQQGMVPWLHDKKEIYEVLRLQGHLEGTTGEPRISNGRAELMAPRVHMYH